MKFKRINFFVVFSGFIWLRIEPIAGCCSITASSSQKKGGKFDELARNHRLLRKK
jgi:hypothetical protein